VPGGTFIQTLMASRLVRQMVETIFHNRARRRLAALDQEPIYRSQVRTLVGLVHQGRKTRFGQDHDFGRIHTIRDFQRLVPLRTFAQLFREFWDSDLPDRDNTTWPHIPFAALIKRTTDRFQVVHDPSTERRANKGTPDTLQEIPLSPALLESHGRAALTALGMVGKCKPRAPLLLGRIVLLARELGLQKRDGVTLGSLESLAISQLPIFVKPSIYGPVDLNSANGPAPEKIIRDLMQFPVTCLAGAANRIARFVTQVQTVSRGRTLKEVWPQLAAVIYTRGFSRVDRKQIMNALGQSGILVMEALFRPEGPIAIEDPRHELLRLLPDHGVFFEFIPSEEIGQTNPRRLSVGEIEPGVRYRLALTSPGIWACLVEGSIRFERCDPPLFEVVELPAKADKTLSQPILQVPGQRLPAQEEAASEFPVGYSHPGIFGRVPI
jgi:hypothetical protein